MLLKNKNILRFLFILFGSIAITACSNMQQNKEALTEQVITDSTIRVALEKQFNTHPYANLQNVDVQVNDGIATLYGSTDNLLQKDEAEEIAENIRGVMGIVNLIDVNTVPVADNYLQERINRALFLDPVLESYEINVEVDSGVVYLSGTTNSWHEKRYASEAVRNVTGVRKIENDIAFVYDQDRPDEDLQADIRSLLLNDVRIEDGDIKVEVNNDTAKLSGTVGSISEKNLAISHAWIAGIKSVNGSALNISSDERELLVRKDKYAERSDLVITEAIRKTFMEDPRLLDHNITIASADGHVILSGSVSNLRARNSAEEDAHNVIGVWKVENKITVDPGMEEPSDSLVAQANMLLENHPILGIYELDVNMMDKGILNVAGNVTFHREKMYADELLSGLNGVAEVNNYIEYVKGPGFIDRISPTTEELPVIENNVEKTDQMIEEDITYLIFWSPFVSDSQISVSVENGVAVLSGTVNTSLEMNYAVKCAYDGGAIHVINDLEVNFWEI